VATFHAFAERSRLLRLSAPVLRTVSRRIAVPLAVSRAAAEFARVAVEGEIDVVPNGVDVDRFARPRGAPEGLPPGRRVMWAHRLDPQKRFPVAVRALGRLAEGREDLALVVAGDGGDRDALDLLPAPARARVAMLGTVPNDDLPPYLAGADVFVAPALGQESFGIALVEAMAAGVPVVASDIPGYREVVRDGVDGLLVPPRDPGALAAAMARVLDDPELASTLARAGRERAREFSWDVVAPAIEARYRRATGSDRGTG
jgi:phosphatidylinositol alpha-mannosyltransferase